MRRGICLLRDVLNFVLGYMHDNPSDFPFDLNGPVVPIVSVKYASKACHELGVGANEEPKKIAHVSSTARKLMVAMIVGGLTTNQNFSTLQIKNEFYNFMDQLKISSELSDAQLMDLIEELKCAGILGGGQKLYGGRMRPIDATKPEYRWLITPASMLLCPDLEDVYLRHLKTYFENAKKMETEYLENLEFGEAP
jgi:hypothetical protein